MKVAFNEFVRRQTPESPYSHFNGADEELLQMVRENLDRARPSYRKAENGEEAAMPGVLVVPVTPDKFYTGVVVLKNGDELIGSFSPRAEGEEPRKHLYKRRGQGEGKAPAKYADIIIYSHEVLVENNEHSTDADWEIISINARLTEGEQPIQPITLIANHFEWSGGTKTNMTDKQFVEALRVSCEYWRNKALLEGE